MGQMLELTPQPLHWPDAVSVVASYQTKMESEMVRIVEDVASAKEMAGDAAVTAMLASLLLELCQRHTRAVSTRICESFIDAVGRT